MTDEHNYTYYEIILGTGIDSNDALAGAIGGVIVTKQLDDVEVLDAHMYDHGGVGLEVGTTTDVDVDAFYDDDAVSVLDGFNWIESVQEIGVTQQ